MKTRLKPTRLFLLLGLAGAISSPAWAEGDPVAGKVEFAVCTGCHSLPGYANVAPRYHVPKLQGQHAQYLVAALQAYAKDERDHLSMAGNAESLSEASMQNIAAYLSKKRLETRINKVKGDIQAGESKAVSCNGCHGARGKSTMPGYPRLDGQYQSYLIQALNDYKSGKRKNPMMTGMTAALSDEDIQNISAYYASQTRGLRVVD